MTTYTIDDIKAANKAAGKFFFDPETMRTFKRRLSPIVYQGPVGVYFVTSEVDFNDNRSYNVRKCYVDTGEVVTCHNYTRMTKRDAHRSARQLAGI